VALVEIRIDPEMWAEASEPRRNEWSLAIQELLEEHDFARGAPARLEVILDDGAAYLRWFDGVGGAIAAMTLPRGSIGGHIDGYVGICRRMRALGHGAASARLEALDMAKRLAHDDAGRALQASLAALSPDHPTARRLFTLLVTLFVDTTRLSMVHDHRRFPPR
jgi:uncharacterized protein (UPF0262 family)